jgi:hypothetical protein
MGEFHGTEKVFLTIAQNSKRIKEKIGKFIER